MSYTTYLIFYFVLSHSISFLCSLLEAALLSCTPSYASILANRHPKLSESLKRLKTSINEPLAAILTFNTAAHTIGAAGVGAMVEVLYGDVYLTVASIIVTLTMLYISEMIPKTIGSLYWRSLIVYCVPIIEVMIKVSYPFVHSFQWVARLLGAKVVFPAVDEHEVRSLIEEGAELGVFEELEKKIVFRVFNIADSKAKDFMVNRTKANWIDSETTKDELKSIVDGNHEGVFLVCKRDPDNFLGYVKTSDILLLLCTDDDRELNEIVKKPLFYPENIAVLPLIESLFKDNESIAFLVDEYGGIVGYVSMDVILNEFVKDVITSFPSKAELVKQVGDEAWLVDGALLIKDFKEMFSIDVQAEVDMLGYHTLAGFCLTQLQTIPKEGEEFFYQDYRFKVVEMHQQRIIKVLITKNSQNKNW